VPRRRDGGSTHGCFRIFTKDWPFVLLTIAFILLATLSALLQPFPLAVLISQFTHQPSDHWAHRLFSAITPNDPVRGIVVLAVATLVLRVLQELFTAGKSLANIRVGYSGLMRVRCALFNKLQQLSIAYHRQHPVRHLRQVRIVRSRRSRGATWQ
jgi:subfamily B ATP-binding cassette protein MsbA